MSLELQPVTLLKARHFIDAHHRHHGGPIGGKFAIGLNRDGVVVGVVVVGGPIARNFDDGWTAEVTRCCVLEGVRNGCSMLYGASRRAALAMGYRRLITYTRCDEPGTSLLAAGWKIIAERPARSWQLASKSRPRVDTTDPIQRKLWEAPA